MLDFRAYDKNNLGIVTSSTLHRILEQLKFDFSGSEMESIRPLLRVTNDGYVLYKDLQEAVNPRNPNSKSQLGDIILPGAPLPPKDEESVPTIPELPNHPAALRTLVTGNLENLRRIFNAYDRGALDDRRLKDGIMRLGIPLSKDFERLVTTHGPSRTLKFSTLITSLQVEDATSGHRLRDSLPKGVPAVPIVPSSALDPLAWRDEPLKGSLVSREQLNEHLVRGGRLGPNSNAGTSIEPINRSLIARQRESPPRVPLVGSQLIPRGEILKRILADYTDGKLPFSIVKVEFSKLGLEFHNDASFSQLVRKHEAGSSVQFNEFLRAVYRIDPSLLNDQQKSAFPPVSSSIPPYIHPNELHGNRNGKQSHNHQNNQSKSVNNIMHISRDKDSSSIETTSFNNPQHYSKSNNNFSDFPYRKGSITSSLNHLSNANIIEESEVVNAGNGEEVASNAPSSAALYQPSMHHHHARGSQDYNKNNANEYHFYDGVNDDINSEYLKNHLYSTKEDKSSFQLDDGSSFPGILKSSTGVIYSSRNNVETLPITYDEKTPFDVNGRPLTTLARGKFSPVREENKQRQLQQLDEHEINRLKAHQKQLFGSSHGDVISWENQFQYTNRGDNDDGQSGITADLLRKIPPVMKTQEEPFGDSRQKKPFLPDPNGRSDVNLAARRRSVDIVSWAPAFGTENADANIPARRNGRRAAPHTEESKGRNIICWM